MTSCRRVIVITNPNQSGINMYIWATKKSLYRDVVEVFKNLEENKKVSRGNFTVMKNTLDREGRDAGVLLMSSPSISSSCRRVLSS